MYNTPPVTILVNSSDGFDDCWPPFFVFMTTYWPRLDFPVLLNTETRTFSYPGVDLACSKVATGEMRRLSWSECLIRAIGMIETPLLLYMQEDYFIDTPVDEDAIGRAIELMLSNPDIGHVGLTKHGSHGPFLQSQYPGFSTIRKDARYRISTQAGLWRPHVLRSYLHPEENGWMFEIFGTKRSRRKPDLFLVSDFGPGTDGPAIDYTHTGIIKGKWHANIPDLFERHKIEIDFGKRGFYHTPPFLFKKLDLITKLSQNLGYALRQIFN